MTAALLRNHSACVTTAHPAGVDAHRVEISPPPRVVAPGTGVAAIEATLLHSRLSERVDLQVVSDSERFLRDEQAGRIRDWAALHGHTVADVWEELDESGARADPATAPALASSKAILVCNTVVEEPEGYLAPETHAEAAWAR